MSKSLLALILTIVLSSCLKITSPVIDFPETIFSGSGVFIVNEGNFKSGNGSLSFFSYDSLKLYNNTFTSVNNRILGDVPYSVNITGGNAYIVVNNSGKIEVVDINDLTTVKTINNIKAPRYISFVNNSKAYITSLYSDSITILALSTNEVAGYIDLKHSSESMAVTYSEAFVANWAGGNKVFVIDIINDRVIDSVEVGIEPESMVLDRDNKLWVLCNGGWQREHFAELISINTQSHKVEKRFTFPSVIDSPTCLQIDGSGENLYYILDGVRKMNIYATSLPPVNFIPKVEHNFYKLGINPANTDIFVTDAKDYQHKGSVLRYNSDGGLLSVMEADIIPGGMYFKFNTGSAYK